jgi:hypothetical protein
MSRADYVLHGILPVPGTGRYRWCATVLIHTPPSPGADAAALAAAARQLMQLHPDGQAFALYGYRAPEETPWPYTVGVAHATRDGRGWGGDGALDVGGPWGRIADRGQICVILGNACEGRSHEQRVEFAAIGSPGAVLPHPPGCNTTRASAFSGVGEVAGARCGAGHTSPPWEGGPGPAPSVQVPDYSTRSPTGPTPPDL